MRRGRPPFGPSPWLPDRPASLALDYPSSACSKSHARTVPVSRRYSGTSGGLPAWATPALSSESERMPPVLAMRPAHSIAIPESRLHGLVEAMQGQPILMLVDLVVDRFLSGTPKRISR